MNSVQLIQGKIGIEVHFNSMWSRVLGVAGTWTLKGKMALISNASQETMGEKFKGSTAGTRQVHVDTKLHAATYQCRADQRCLAGPLLRSHNVAFPQTESWLGMVARRRSFGPNTSTESRDQ